MSQRTDEFVAACRAAVRDVKDPVELQRRLTEMVEQEFPVAPAPFARHERMPLHEFIARFQSAYTGNVAPVFYQWPVIAQFDELGDLCMVFAGTRAAPAATSEAGLNGALALERLERSEALERPAPEAAGK